MCEHGRRSRSWIGLIPKIHSCDKTTVHGKYVENFALRQNIPLKTLDELVHPDADLASVCLDDCQRFDMGIEFAPLSGPIGTDLLEDQHSTQRSATVFHSISADDKIAMAAMRAIVEPSLGIEFSSLFARSGGLSCFSGRPGGERALEKLPVPCAARRDNPA
jgi:hypothetical protein